MLFKFVGSTIPVVVSEIFYNPSGQSEDEEFIELYNYSGSQTIDLSGFSFTDGITFTFPPGTSVAPGGRIVVAKDLGVFTSTYGTPPAGVLFGPYGGALANGGERIVLSAPGGGRVIDFTYNDSSTWPQLADGEGRSLQLIGAASNPDANLAASWEDSCQTDGSPGFADVMDFSSWKVQHGVSGDFADDDGDGRNHFLEYAFGTDPLLGDDELSPAASAADGYLTIQFRRNLAAKDVAFTVEVSDDLTVWESGPAETVLVGLDPER